MKRYEGLFILSNSAGKEEGVKDVIDHISADITAAGGRVETVQKMDKKQFSRTANRKNQSGFYANVIFECEASSVNALRAKFRLNEEIFRVVFTEASAVAVAVANPAVAPVA